MDVIPNCQLPLDWTVGSGGSNGRRQQQQQQQQQLTDLDSYKAEVAFKFSEAWKLARDNIILRSTTVPEEAI